MRRVLILGGANGIGLGIATALAEREEVERIYIVDKVQVDSRYQNEKFKWYYFNLDETEGNRFFDKYMFFDRFMDIDGLIITAGFGSLKLFKDITESEIDSYFRVNTIPAMRLIKKFYSRLDSKSDFYCGVLVSIAGHLPSPWLSVYGATKSALQSFIASVNVELKKSGSVNQILEVSPGHIDGTSFSGGETDLDKLADLSKEILNNLEEKNDLFIPDYEKVYREVLRRSQEDFRAEGEKSYEYKKSRL